jgi:hypothetical protein
VYTRRDGDGGRGFAPARPGCPNLAATRELLAACVAEVSGAAGLPVTVVERVGA